MEAKKKEKQIHIVFLYVNEHYRTDILFEAKMPFIPKVGREILFSFEDDRHYAKIEQLEYVFNDKNEFQHVNARVGEF